MFERRMDPQNLHAGVTLEPVKTWHFTSTCLARAIACPSPRGSKEHAMATDEASGSWPKPGLEHVAMTVRRNCVGRL